MNTISDILKKVLKLLNYNDVDITKIEVDLNRLILLESFEILLTKLTPDKQHKLRAGLKSDSIIDDKEIIKKIMKEQFSEKDIQDQIRLTTFNIVSDYINNMIESSSEDNKKLIVNLLSS